MADPAKFDVLFEKLKLILHAHEPTLRVQTDEPGNYYLNTPFSEKFQKELFFGAVQIKKNYVSFHLMPVYMYPDLLDTLSPQLKKRMQGKSCFNFTAIDEATFAELAQLTEQSVKRIRQEETL